MCYFQLGVERGDSPPHRISQRFGALNPLCVCSMVYYPPSTAHPPQDDSSSRPSSRHLLIRSRCHARRLYCIRRFHKRFRTFISRQASLPHLPRSKRLFASAFHTPPFFFDDIELVLYVMRDGPRLPPATWKLYFVFARVTNSETGYSDLRKV